MKGLVAKTSVHSVSNPDTCSLRRALGSEIHKWDNWAPIVYLSSFRSSFCSSEFKQVCWKEAISGGLLPHNSSFRSFTALSAPSFFFSILFAVALVDMRQGGHSFSNHCFRISLWFPFGLRYVQSLPSVPGSSFRTPALASTGSCRLEKYSQPESWVMFYLMGIFRTSSPGGNVSGNPERTAPKRQEGRGSLQQRAGSLHARR